jgi:hypothetical protein
MSDALTITIPHPLADEVRAAAEARGLSPEEYVRFVVAEDIELEQELAAEYDGAGDKRGMPEPGESIPADEVFAEMMARLEARNSTPRK